MQDNPTVHPDHSIKDGLLLYKGPVLVPPDTALQPLLLTEFHSSLIGGHVGIQRTFA